MSIHFSKKVLALLAPVPVAIMLLVGLSLGCATAALSADPTAGTIQTPADKSTLTSTLVKFEWVPGTQKVKQYWLYVGKGIGEKDIYNEDQKDKLSTYVSGLPIDSSTIYVRLWSHVDNGWAYNDYTYTTCDKCSNSEMIAQLTSPDPNKPLLVLNSTRVVFAWKQGTVAASQFWLTIGKTPGGRQYYNANEKMNMTDTVGRLPNDGSTIHVRLWSLISDAWLYNDYTFITCNGCAVDGVPAEIKSPEPGSMLQSSVVTFKWDPGTGVTAYRLSVGKTKGGTDIYDKMEEQRHSDTVTGIPTDGNTIFVRLSSKISESWLSNDYTYTTCKDCVDPAEMISPDPGEMLPGSRVTFTWDAGAGIARYKLSIGKTLGGTDYYSAETPTLHRTVSDLPTDGSVIYVRLSSLPRTSASSLSDSASQDSADWKYVDYVYIAYLGSADIAELTSPKPGSTLTSDPVTFAWNKGSDEVDQYWLFVGKTLGGKEIYDGAKEIGTKLQWDVPNVPKEGQPIFVRLWSLIDNTWRFKDYVFLEAPKP